MSDYATGRRIEWIVRDHLIENGYEVLRAASSKGVADVVGFKADGIAFVSVKRTNPRLPPSERRHLLRVAGFYPGVAVALVATKPVGKPLTFRRLTGPGPSEWEPWAADEVAR